MDDVIILGGGVIGLSLACELAGRGQQVRLLERGEFGQEASWAGAGILPAPDRRADAPPIDRLAAFSTDLHLEWYEQLRRETGIDNGYRCTGNLHLARSDDALAALDVAEREFQRVGIAVERLAPGDVARIEPAFDQPASPPILAALYLPDEAQLRNPRYIKALVTACLQRGVEMMPHTPAESFVTAGGHIDGVRTAREVFTARHYCVTGGAWSRELLQPLGCTPVVRPIRGQIALLKSERGPRRILHESPHYMVPRDDGRVLVGSTLEDVGFDKRTTAEAIAELLDFATGLIPSLAAAEVERTWAGLRPGSVDGQPYLGRIPEWENGYIAAGHFRWGIQLSCATAVLMSQLITGEPTTLSLTPFRVDRMGVDVAATS